MAQNVPLDKGDTAIEPFFDATQELLSAAAPHFQIAIQTASTIRVASGSNANDQSGIAVGGQYRYRVTNIDATAAGAAATYEIYVTASDNDFTGPPEDLDSPTDYNFGLTIRAIGSPPVGVDEYRKVGELDWDGTNITQIRQIVGDRNDMAPHRPTAPLATVIPFKIRGAASQSAALLVVENSAGTALLTVNASGQLSQGLTISHTDGLVLSANGGKDTLSLSNTTADVGLTIGADTNLYRASANVLKTDDAFQSATTVTAYVGTATQVQIGNVGPGSTAGLSFGSASDAVLYRSAADMLRTPDSVTIDGNLTVTGTSALTGDPELTALSSLTSAADRLPYFTGSGSAALATFTAGGRALVNSAGTADTFPYFSAANTVTLASITAAGRTLLDDADATAQRTTLAAAGTGTVNTFSQKQTFSGEIQVNGAFNHDGTTFGIFNEAPVTQRSAYTNASGVTEDRSLPSGATANDVMKAVIALMNDSTSLGFSA